MGYRKKPKEYRLKFAGKDTLLLVTFSYIHFLERGTSNELL